MKKKLLNSVLITTLAIFGLSNPVNAQLIAGGQKHTLAHCGTGTAMAWGDNMQGQLGNGANGTSNVAAVPVSFLTVITAISGGGGHSIALKNDGTVWTWGANSTGQLGNGTNFFSNVPVQVSSLTGMIAIDAGPGHSIALKNDGTVWTWGYNYYGQLGNGNTTNSNVPVQVSSLTGITAIEGGSNHFLALKNDGTVWAWGWNQFGELGNGTNTSSNVPVQVSSITGIIAISGGGENSFALKNDGTVRAWGFGLNGELGNGTNTYFSNVPVSVSSITGITAIEAGLGHVLALKNDGTVWTWGKNGDGQLGNGTNTNSNVPVQVSSLTGITAIAAGYDHSIALKNDATVWTWGDNLYSQLGNGTSTDSNVPVQVTGLCAVAVSVNEIAEPLSVSVFPNPFNSELKIVSSSNNRGEVILFDITGKEILRQKTFAGETKLNIEKIDAGLYLLNYSDENKTANIKVVKF